MNNFSKFATFLLIIFLSSCVTFEPKSKDLSRRVPAYNRAFLIEQNITTEPTDAFVYYKRGKLYQAPKKVAKKQLQISPTVIEEQQQPGFFAKLFGFGKKKEENKQEAIVAKAAPTPVIKEEDFIDEIPIKKTVTLDSAKTKSESQPVFLEERKVSSVIMGNKIAKPVKKGTKDSDFFIQVGAYKVQKNANKIANSAKKYGNVSLKPFDSDDANIYRVRIGPFKTYQEASDVRRNVVGGGHKGAIVIKE